MANPIKQIIFAQKAAPSGVEEIMSDPASVGASGGMFTVDPGNVLNVTDLFVVSERVANGITRFRVRFVTGALSGLAGFPIMLFLSINGSASTEFSLDEPRPLGPGTYIMTVEEPGVTPSVALAALQLVGVGNART